RPSSARSRNCLIGFRSFSRAHAVAREGDDMEASERAQRAADALSDVTEVGGVTVSSVELDAENNAVKFVAQVDALNFSDTFVVVNPPILVEDPDGDVMVRGKAHREDPAAAIAQAVVQYASGRTGRVMSS